MPDACKPPESCKVQLRARQGLFKNAAIRGSSHLNRVQLETCSASLPRPPGERRSDPKSTDLKLDAFSSFDAPNASNFNMNGWTGISTNRLNPAAEGRGVGVAPLPAGAQGTGR